MGFFEEMEARTGKGINDEQRNAIEATEGAVLVAAGAGTGKTTMITAKAAYLIREKKLDPKRIVMLTFGRDAARHMKDEIVHVIPEARDIEANTFHSFCYNFLLKYGDRTGITEEYKLLGEADAEFLLFKELNIPAFYVGRIVTTILRAKDLDLTRQDYEDHIARLKASLCDYIPDGADPAEEAEKARVRQRTMYLEEPSKAMREEKQRLEAFVKRYDDYLKYVRLLDAWNGYERLKAEKKLLDYADMIRMAIEYAGDVGEDELAGLYDYVIVDEFQDTNRQQFKLLKILASKHGNITAVGDVNQAIYAFRGAYPENLDEFKKEFKADVKDLTMNYRSTDMVLRTAHRLIKNNYEDPDEAKPLKSAFGTEGVKVTLIRALDPAEQARRVAEEIGTLASNGIKYNDIAVLFRSHASSREIQGALERRNVPFQLMSNYGFLKRPEVRTALAYLYVLANFENPVYGADQMWWRLLHFKYGLSLKDSHVLATAAKRDTIQNVITGNLPSGLSGSGRETIRALLEKIDLLRNSKNKSLSDLLVDVYEYSGLSRAFSYCNDKESVQAMMNLGALHGVVDTFESFYGTDLRGFVEYIRMMDEMGEEMESPAPTVSQGVVLRTCHGVKGLEYDHVFIVDLVEDKFPITKGGAEPLIPDEMNDRYKDIFETKWESEKKMKDAVAERKKSLKLKEERRLAYVSFTRAKKALYLCHAVTYGENDRDASRFVTESCYENDVVVVEDIEYIEDNVVTVIPTGPMDDLARKKNEVKRLLLATMDSEPEMALYNLLLYENLCGKSLSVNGREAAHAVEDAGIILEDIKDGRPTGMEFIPENVKLSHSSLKVYRECPKKYELSRLLRMPTRHDDEEGESPLSFGTFVHAVLEETVKKNPRSREDMEVIVSEVRKKPDFKEINVNRAKVIFDVFWKRNGGKIGKNAMTEQPFNFVLNGFYFNGKIDRVDVLQDGECEIIDYKTGKEPSVEDRASQLILYMLAFEHDPALKATGLKPKRLTLELLEENAPRVFEIGDDGLIVCVNGRCKSINVEKTRDELLEVARSIAHDYEKGFEPADDCGKGYGSPCEYRMYCPRWG